MKYALINKDTGKVDNIIIWDGFSVIELPDNVQAEVCTEAHELEWSSQAPTPLNNEEQEKQLLQLLLQKYGGTDSPLGLS